MNNTQPPAELSLPYNLCALAAELSLPYNLSALAVP